MRSFRRFYQTSSDDPALFERVNGAADEAAVVAIARELGLECDAEDLEAVLRPHVMAGGAEGELSDEQLESVAGGGGFSLTIGKVPAPPAPFVPLPYPNW